VYHPLFPFRHELAMTDLQHSERQFRSGIVDDAVLPRDKGSDDDGVHERSPRRVFLAREIRFICESKVSGGTGCGVPAVSEARNACLNVASKNAANARTSWRLNAEIDRLSTCAGSVSADPDWADGCGLA